MIVQVCLHFARKLLRDRTKWPLHDFMQTWQSSTPEVCLHANEVMLQAANQKAKPWRLIWIESPSCDAMLPSKPALGLHYAGCVPGVIHVDAFSSAVNTCRWNQVPQPMQLGARPAELTPIQYKWF